MDQKMKTFSTFYRIFSFLLVMLVHVTLSTGLSGQCQMACVDKVNTSVDPLNSCRVTITASTMMKATPGCPVEDYQVKVKYGSTILGFADTITLDRSFLGKTVEVTVLNGSGNSCWGSLKIEDKSAPIIECPTDTLDIYCFDLTDIHPDSLDVEVTECTGFVWSKQGLASIDECPEPGILKYIEQVWRATDTGNGMFSTCTLRYNVLAIEEEDIVFPENDTVQCNSGYAVVPGTTYPSPSVTGYPFADLGDDGIKNLIPGDAALLENCGIMVSMVDRPIKADKLMRTWTINGWFCGTEFDTTLSQIIIISDTIAPGLTVTPSNVTVTTSGHVCAANIKLNNYFKATPTDNCTSATVTVSNDSLGLINPAAFTAFPLGIFNLIYTATDVAGNTTTKVVVLTVEDNTPPVAVCIENTVVSVTSDGTAKVPAKYFDNGSRDECGAVTFEVRRMDRLAGCFRDTSVSWLPYVEFCCLDSRAPVIIELRVTDQSGNSNTCMVNVRVQDKLRPVLQCLDDVTITCNTNIKLDSASLASTYGTINIIDNCGGSKVKHSVVDNRDKCNVGPIIRKWVVSDGLGIVDSCEQIIYSESNGSTRFYINPENPADTTDHIIWPAAEVTLEGCTDPNSPALSPDVLGKPIILYDRFSCGNIAMSPKDEVFTFNSPLPGSAQACLKIKRTWTVIDWCQQGSVSRPWTFIQIIKVENNFAPRISRAIALDSCITSAICDTLVRTRLEASATDDCTGNMSWTYSIDINNNNAGPLNGFDIVKTGTGTSINASNELLPLGTHRIVYTFRDLCGNDTSQTVIFTLKNCKKPTPIYYDGLVFGLTRMNGTGMAVTWANDFDLKSEAPCGAKLYFAFSENIADSGLVFTCADLGTKVIKVYVGAEVAPGMIIWNFADVTVSIQDNGTPKACSNPTAMNTVRGQLITEVNANLKGAVIALDGNTSERLMTDDSGLFSFNQVAAGRDYMLKPVKDDDHANGINTLDLLHIQRHILGMSTLRSPYKLIAADVDKDSRVGVSDLVALRKLVLRSTDRFEKNTSWRFIDKNFQFKDPSEALNEVFSEQYEIINLTENMKIDFIAVKVGDVDGTAATNAKSSAKTTARSGQKLAFTVNNQNVSKGEIFDVTLSVEELSTVFGMQYQLNFDPNSAELIEAKSFVNGTTAQNYNLAEAGRGNILSSWTAPYGQEMKDMVTFTFKAKRNLNTNSLLSFRDEWLTSEAYDENLEAIQLEMRNGGKVIEGFNLYQNNPNPFNDLTSVSFDLPESMNARFTIFDVTGKVIKQINRKFEGGKNTIQIESNELENAGVYFYSLEAGGFNATKKMVILE